MRIICEFKSLIIFLLIAGILLPSFSFSQEPSPTEIPKTIEKGLPEIIKKVWQEEVLPIWQKMWDWLKINIWPQIESLYKKIVEPEVEKRKPFLEEEFQKEKEEMKEGTKTELPKVGQSLWEKFKEIIR